MRKEYQFIDGCYVTRRDKRTARKDYEKGYTIYIVPVNMTLQSMWHRPARIQKDFYLCETRTFDTVCNIISAYQCNNETGRYLKYYTVSDSERE